MLFVPKHWRPVSVSEQCTTCEVNKGSLCYGFKMPTCVAYGCANRASKKIPGVTFHSFPKDNERRKKWIRAIRRENWTPTPFSTICSAHFTERDFDRTSLCVVRLKEWAVPSVFAAFPKYLQIQSKNQSCMEKTCHNFGKRRSLVRRLGSALTLKPAPRIFLARSESSVHEADECLNYSHSRSQPDVVTSTCDNVDSFDDVQLKKISSLEQEILQLKSLVDQILSQPKYRGWSNEEEKNEQAVPSRPPPPPPPPPLPPPPLPTCTVRSSVKMDISKKRTELKDTRAGLMSLGEVVKDISKVKLRHVERTSTGSPIRQARPQNDPRDVLAAVLRRINSATQMDLTD